MSGFFSIKETESKDRPGGKKVSCMACGAYRNCTSPRMQATGEFRKEILIVGSSPERTDDQNGAPFQSRYGQHLKRVLEKCGVDLEEDCLSINACLCCTTTEDNEHRAPTNFELECCRKTVLNVVNERKPKLIIILGQSALFSLIGHRWKRDLDTIDKWRGWTIPDQDFKAWVCPTYDPKQVVQWKRDELYTVFEQDIKQAVEMLKTEFRVYRDPVIEFLPEGDLRRLEQIKKLSIAAFDYETTGIKPHAEGHKIICCSIAVNPNLVYVFMMPESRKARQPFIDFLKNPLIKKVAQNMKFEHAWSLVRLKTEVQNWHWDTMLVSHMLDNRSGVTGLKFQTYVQFGIVDYETEVSPWLKSTEERNANGINKIEELIKTPEGRKALMKYCALDSINEYRLYELQESFILGLPF